MADKAGGRLPWLIRDASFYKKIALIALPIAGQNVISFGVGLADNLMVSHLGESAISGIYTVNQIQNILQMLVMGLGAALVILAAQYYGKGNLESVRTISATSLKIAVGVGLALLAIMSAFGRQVLGLLSDAGPVVEDGLVYVGWLKWSFVFFCVTNVLLAAMRCAGSVNIGIATALVAFFSNIIFNYIFIFGKLGFPAMGVAGAALATLVSRVIECAIIVFYALRVDRKIRFSPRDLLLHDGALLRDYFRYGLPVIFGDIFWGFGGAAQAAIIGRLGESVIAASSIVGNLGQMFSVFVYGVASAGSLVVGQAIGQNDFEAAKRGTKTLQLVYIGVGLVSASAMLALRGAVLSIPLFGSLAPETMRYAMQFITVLCFMLIGTSYQMSSLQIVRAGGATHFVLMNDLIFVWLVIIPMALAAHYAFGAPPWVVFLCLKSDQVLKCGVAVVKVNRFRWMKNLTR
ncbi:MAG: MATE family efflux transporter [Clostridiales bacterium]|jgi:putative MATE family efflux protein|nr:MATE family efflux transporter [Clostridiales bacterium]